MSTTSDDDGQQRFVLGFVFALVALFLVTVVGLVVHKYGLGRGAAQVPGASAPAPAVAVAAQPAAAVEPEGAGIQVADGVVSFFFATGSADVAPGAGEALAQVIQGVAAGRQAVVSGFHDTTGDQAINEALAKKRAESVRDVLLGLGVPAEQVRLEKPAETAGSGSNAQARRVEVRLLD